MYTVLYSCKQTVTRTANIINLKNAPIISVQIYKKRSYSKAIGFVVVCTFCVCIKCYAFNLTFGSP